MFLNILFLINFSIANLTELTLKLFILIALGAASGNPPLLDIITAQPLLAASRAVLPNGSSHLEHTTAIWDFINHLDTLLCSKKPKISNLLWLNVIFSLGSSPITIAFQSGYFSSILITAFPKMS